MKRHFCIFLSICFILFALPVSAGAERGEDFSCGQSLVWTFHDASATLTVTGEGEMTDFSPVPARRAPWQKYNAEIEHIVIGEGVTGIGDYAFSRIYAQTVTLPDTLMQIGSHAFNDSGIISLELPASVNFIGEAAFACSDRLAAVTMHASDGLQIGADAFVSCTALSEVLLPQSPLSIGKTAFFNTALKEVWLPETVVYAPLAFDFTTTVYRMIDAQYRRNGDCDGDNTLNAQDLLQVQNRILSDGEDDLTADVNIDSRINVLDMIRLKRLLTESDF